MNLVPKIRYLFGSKALETILTKSHMCWKGLYLRMRQRKGPDT